MVEVWLSIGSLFDFGEPDRLDTESHLKFTRTQLTTCRVWPRDAPGRFNAHGHAQSACGQQCDDLFDPQHRIALQAWLHHGGKYVRRAFLWILFFATESIETLEQELAVTM